MKTFLKILGAFVAIVMILFLWALQRVDYTPYFNSHYYSLTRSRLDSISDGLCLAQGRVQVGFGKVSITPSLHAGADDPASGAFTHVPLAGYGQRKGAPAEGIHDSLFIKAVAVRAGDQLLVLVGSDMLIVPPNITEGVCRTIREEMGIGRKQVFFSATHTHAGVGAWSHGYVGKAFAGDPNPAVVDWLISMFSQAIGMAVNDLQPGQIGSGSFDAADFVRNRLVGEKGDKNAEFVFLLAHQQTGKMAVLGSFDAHATTLGGDNMLFSGDYPGYWQRKLEESGIDMAVFFAGSMGSHGPRSTGEGFEKPQYMGEALADSVLKYMGISVLKDSIGLASISLQMGMPEYHIRVSDGIRLNPVIGGKLFPPAGDVYLQAARIGDLMWATAPCDFSGEMAVRYKNAMSKEGYRALVTSFNGTYVGYIIPGKYYHLDEYESRLMSWYGPNMGPYTDEMFMRMLRKLTSI
jgi:hypothetical protein